MSCCGGAQVSPVVMRLVAPRVRARRAPLPLLVILPEPQDLAAVDCPYCGSDFADRVEKTSTGAWTKQHWCMTCKLRFPCP